MAVKQKTTKNSNVNTNNLYRSTKNELIAGVCSGIGEYLKIDPTLVRIIFVLLAIIHGIGIIFYLILWLIIPTTENSNLKGDEKFKINADEIKQKAIQYSSSFDRDNEGKFWFGIIIIILGAIFLFNNLGIFQIDLGKLWPILLIIFGFFLLTKKN